jgi:hypothetical protein
MANATPTGMDSNGQFVIGGNFVGGFYGVTNSVFRQTSTVTVANTTAETSIVGSGLGSNSIASNVLQAGMCIRVSGSGVYSTLAVLPGNLTINIKFGGVTISTTTITNLLLGAANAGFDYTAIINVNSSGVSGSAQMAGQFAYLAALSGSRLFGDLNNSGNAQTLNTTIANTVGVTCQWATASASNTLKSTVCVVEVLM